MRFFRRQLFAVDVFFLGFLALLLAITLAAAPGKHTGELLVFLALVGAVYLALQRLGIAHVRKGERAPRWLVIASFVYVLSPMALVPLTFLQLGKVMRDAGLIVSVERHPDFDPTPGRYDPDHAGDKGLRLGPYGAATWHDLELKRYERAIFGTYSPEWAKRFHTPALTGFMQLGYLFYYIAPICAALPLFFMRRWRDLRGGVAVIVGCLLSTYLGYLAVPATGPRFEGGIEAWLPTEPGWFGAEGFYRMIDAAESFRWDAFPSGHVAVSLVCLLVALRFYRKVGYAMIPPVLALCASTIYMGYHYGVDVLAGIVFAFVCAAVIPPFVQRWERLIWAETVDPHPAVTLNHRSEV